MEYVKCWIAKLALKALLPFGYLQAIVLYSLDLQKLTSTIKPDLPVHIAPASESDFETIALLCDDHDPEILRERWGDGHKCFVAKYNGNIVGYNWIAVTDIEEDEFFFSLHDGDVVCLDAFVGREYRGQKIHAALLSEMLIFARNCGYRRAYTRVDLYNWRSWKSHQLLQWNRVGLMLHFLPRWRAFGDRIKLTPLIPPMFLKKEKPFNSLTGDKYKKHASVTYAPQ